MSRYEDGLKLIEENCGNGNRYIIIYIEYYIGGKNGK
jgi:hypothetical protein